MSIIPHAPSLPPVMVRDAVRAALLEDLGLAGDLTSNATIPASATARAVMNSREEGVLAGITIAEAAFRESSAELSFEALVKDGESLAPGQDVAIIEGPARAILAAERVALNYACHLSGIASYTAQFARIIKHTTAQVCCTRKTIPGLRTFEKYAVKCGGGSNHRFGLDDAILIKDNHIAVCGGVQQAIAQARAFAGHLIKIEVEVDTLEQLSIALEAGPDVVMLDNMSLEQLREGVAIVDGRIPIEASGNVNIDTIQGIAETGVDMISTSKITMSAPTLDLGLDIRIKS
ncbi:carboxylating nicotinate-nucleotide diphosphorylase [Ahrensia sp. R2A130]|uniref:carboxylating nicotinate-nucleotide diphosphorylase n=1 Tax=Ahrensia sp. R2A130 TaxID=744979 RepID=UPI0001E0A43F|nr:carboxylating nicotinate-nucleotide diphosphorylase [Ahrensia sp. R2A130]EFL90647.1 nicotinate-nucleotide diphosphorylase (carboxylating) [Ahrensia sp. R2A130]